MNVKRLTLILVAISVVLVGCQPGNAPAATSPTSAPANGAPTDQDTSVKLTVAIPSFLSSLFTDRLINDFENAHPGVTVSLVKLDANIPPAAAGLDKHFQAVQQYTSSADVLYVA